LNVAVIGFAIIFKNCSKPFHAHRKEHEKMMKNEWSFLRIGQTNLKILTFFD